MSIKTIKDLNNIFCKGFIFKIKDDSGKTDKYVFGYKHISLPWIHQGTSEAYYEISTNRREYSGWEIQKNPSKYRKEIKEHTKRVDGNIIILDESYFQKYKNFFTKLKTQIRKNDRIFIEDKELQAMIEKVTQKTSNEDIQLIINKVPKKSYDINNGKDLYFKNFGLQLKITETLENAQIFGTMSELLGVISSSDLSRYSNNAGSLMANILPNVDNINEKFQIIELTTSINQKEIDDLLSDVTIEIVNKMK